MKVINGLRLYSKLSHFPYFRESYTRKVLFATLIGTLLPLLLLSVYLLMVDELNKLNILIIATVATLFGIGIALLLTKALLEPVFLISDALRNHLTKGEVSKLPIGFQDALGQLMTDVEYMIEKFDLAFHPQKHDGGRDPLTGLMSQGIAEERLRQDLARAYRDEIQILVALAEVDNLEEIKTRYGHHLGDVCLVHTAELLSNSIREGDWLARWDFNKFLIIFWNINHAQPTDVLERVRRHCTNAPIEESLHLNLVIGGCECKGEIVLEMLLICVLEALKVAEKDHSGVAVSNDYLVEGELLYPSLSTDDTIEPLENDVESYEK